MEFGLTISGLAVLAMASAIILIIFISEILKRTFFLLKHRKTYKEEEAVIATAVLTFLSNTQDISKHTIKRDSRPPIWNLAGRLDTINSQIRRGWRNGKEV